MEPESSLPYPQVPATCPYPEPAPSYFWHLVKFNRLGKNLVMHLNSNVFLFMKWNFVHYSWIPLLISPALRTLNFIQHFMYFYSKYYINYVLLTTVTGTSAVHINPLNAELNPICHLLALLGTHHVLHVSGVRVNWVPCHHGMKNPQIAGEEDDLMMWG
jgi:hypothetical protein